MTEEKHYLTEEGLKDLQEQYNYLVHVVREEITEELKAARAQGDLSENADYDAARDRQGKNEGDIRELEYRNSEQRKTYIENILSPLILISIFFEEGKNKF